MNNPTPTREAVSFGEYWKQNEDRFIGDSWAISDIADSVWKARDAEIASLKKELEELRNKLKHPYPTAWAYEKTCEVLHKTKAELEVTKEALKKYGRHGYLCDSQCNCGLKEFLAKINEP